MRSSPTSRPQRPIRTLLILLLIGAFYAVLFALGIHCPIRYVLGISCPGCGMTRACLCALTGRFAEAFAYHPLWVALVPSAVWLLVLWRTGRTRALRISLLVMALGLLAVYLVRLCTGAAPEVVVFSPEESLPWRLYRRLCALGG